MQQQLMPYGWITPVFVPLPPIIDDKDLFINSVVNSNAGPLGPPGPPGADGVSIVSAEVEPNPGNLIITLSDGTVINAGNVIGPPGPPGPPGESIRNTTTIFENYKAKSTDYYIGAYLLDAATLTLPNDVEPGTEYAIKLEFGAPVGNRKLLIQPEAPALINGVTSLTLNTPYQSLNVIYNNGNWWTI